MPFIGRDAALERLRARVASSEPIIGAGTGTGISAKFAEEGGVDLIIIYNSGAFRKCVTPLPPFGPISSCSVTAVR
jgi:predicted TIM-barrel enzyme